MVLIQNELENGSDDCSLGILIMQNIAIDSSEENLNAVKIDLEQSIREKYRESSGKELQMIHPMDVYVTTYKKFGYTYHVLLQLESIIKGKSISNGLAPVKAMFMAELNNLLLTAGHDLEKVNFPLQLKHSKGDEGYLSISGKEVITVC